MKKKRTKTNPTRICSYSVDKFIRVMKLSTLIVALTIFKISASSLPSYGQKIAIDYKKTPLKQVIAAIEEQSNFSFFYNTELINDNALISVKTSSDKIDSVLEEVFKGTTISYKLMNTKIILYKRSSSKSEANNIAEISIVPTTVVQEKVTVKGTVLDEGKVPLIGINVVVKGTTNGTLTDMDGNFSLQANYGDQIEISYLGMKTETRTVTRETTVFKITMLAEVSNLNEVIVVAYDKQSKSSYTGAATNVDVSKISETPVASFQESLQGNIAGVQMSSASGQPGYSPQIRIRGVGSINANSDPLYVVDGIPVVSGNISTIATSSNTIAGINPKDIANITVLKDASATSIYGSRGANGVILITTKRGKSGKTKFDFSTQYGVSDMITADRNKLLTTPENLELLIESRVNTGESFELAQKYIYDRVDESVNTDWQDVIGRTGQYKQYGISASGGSEKTNFYSSLGIFDQQAVIIGVDYKKLNAKVNVDHKASEKLSLNFGLAASNQILHTIDEAGSANNPVRAMTREVPWQPVYNADGTYNTDILLTYNPVGIAKENIRETKLYGILGNIGLNYDFTKNLTFETKANVDFNLSDEFQYDNPYFGEGRNDGGRGRASDNIILNWNVTNLLKYNWEINNTNNVKFLLGQEAQKINANSTYAYASNYGAPGLTTLDNASVYRDASSTKTASSLSSLFFNINYGLANKYFFNATARRDGSSRFGSDVRYANFGSIGLGWDIQKEDFMQDVSFVNKLKFRTSYGINGNQEIGDFASRGLYSTGDNYNEQPGYTYSQQSNPKLTWEKNKPFNVGLDFQLFSIFSGTLDYYTRTTTNLLFKVPISATNGLTSYLDNIGEMKNSGIEFALSAYIFDIPDHFSWKSDFNITTNTNEILKLQNDEPIIDNNYIREVGGDFYTFYMPGYAGVDPDNGNALWYTDATKTATTNNYSKAEPFKQGSALPKYYAGLTNTLSYKNVSLSFMLFLNSGNKVYDTWGRYTSSDGSAKLNDRGNLTRKIYENRWQQPGDITDVPKMVWGNTQSGLSNQHSTRFLSDGTYLRLRDITLAYEFPTDLTNKLKVSSIRLYLKGTNMATWTKDKGLEIDPEVGIDGVANLRIPIAKQILMGLDFSF
ncbi:TonB-dependent receptor [Flavobacterium sp. TAB 87]|uniref:TonB-dependent receptor n=1 Tax=Flavobacterium sp. TAB 87 TaxID=1729581 RepID=UPI00076D0443|nr:TonB-dependent receptor [Flavobacterium sp. TAB 87]KVV13700.1 TonB-linked outer membrane protein, SusC/RagA family [Flavobacterium sp. TAB 87]